MVLALLWRREIVRVVKRALSVVLAKKKQQEVAQQQGEDEEEGEVPVKLVATLAYLALRNPKVHSLLFSDNAPFNALALKLPLFMFLQQKFSLIPEFSVGMTLSSLSR